VNFEAGRAGVDAIIYRRGHVKLVVQCVLVCLGWCVAQAWAVETAVLVDQVGYESSAAKQLVVSADATASPRDFQVHQRAGRDDDWRWTEQWLPHDAWYLYAVSLPLD
jgi:hypothetical protein